MFHYLLGEEKANSFSTLLYPCEEEAVFEVKGKLRRKELKIKNQYQNFGVIFVEKIDL